MTSGDVTRSGQPNVERLERDKLSAEQKLSIDFQMTFAWLIHSTKFGWEGVESAPPPPIFPGYLKTAKRSAAVFGIPARIQ